MGLKIGKSYQCIQSYGPSFMAKFCSALYLENLLTNIFAKLNLLGGVSCMPAALLFIEDKGKIRFITQLIYSWLHHNPFITLLLGSKIFSKIYILAIDSVL